MRGRKRRRRGSGTVTSSLTSHTLTRESALPVAQCCPEGNGMRKYEEKEKEEKGGEEYHSAT